MLRNRRRQERPATITSAPVVRTAVYLLPGQLHASATPCALTTIVGSCIAVCLYDEAAHVGGASHYLLPHPLSSGNPLRYGASAIPQLLREVERLGARRERLQAQVYGGAHIVGITPPGKQHLGSRNAEIARQLLAREGIPIVAEDAEGSHARKILFHTDTGMVWLRSLL
jgi:chemotaxis protein CheD